LFPNTCQLVRGFTIFPQYTGNFKTDRVAHCLTVLCCLNLLRLVYTGVIQVTIANKFPLLGCDLQVKGDVVASSLFYASFQWFLYVRASLSHVTSNPDSKPCYLTLMQIGAILIAISYPIAAATTTNGVIIGGQCLPAPNLILVIAILVLDLPIQVLNFVGFYLPLRYHFRQSAEQLTVTKSIAALSMDDFRNRNNSEALIKAARKSMWLGVITIIFIQLDLVPSILRIQHVGTDQVLVVIRRIGYLGLNFCVWLNVSSKWSCKQSRMCKSDEAANNPPGLEPTKDHKQVQKLAKTISAENSHSSTSYPSGRQDPKALPLLTRKEEHSKIVERNEE
jgi:hypothetical protein